MLSVTGPLKQGQKLTVVLSIYYTNNLTNDDAKSLVAQIKEIGIESGTGLATALGDAGIDARALGKQAGVGGPPPGAPPPGGGPGGSCVPAPSAGKGRDSVDDSIVSLIAQAVESYQNSDTAETLWSVLEPVLPDAGYDTSKPSIDFYA